MKNTLFAITTACFMSAATCMAATLPIKAPYGMTVEKLPAELTSPRFLTFSKEGDMIVGSQGGKIYRLKAPYTTSEVLVDFGGYPHSVALRTTARGQELWVGETAGVWKAPYSARTILRRADFQKVVDLPGGSGHNSRTVKIGPDNRAYVSLGIQANCSVQFMDSSYPEKDRRGGIYVIDETSTTPQLEPFGRGLRNPIGFNWHPSTQVMYADNNGPDHWGFNEPREVFVEVHEGSFFGMPWYQVIKGKVTADPCAPAERAPQLASAVELPLATFDARNAPMDVQFVGQSQLFKNWQGSALVALHGSWAVPAGGSDADRREPKIVLVEFVDGRATGKVSDVLTGLQEANGDRFARPVGLAFGPDNALYFTSDAEGEGVYKVTVRNDTVRK